MTIVSSLVTYEKFIHNSFAVVEVDGVAKEISLEKNGIIALGNGVILEVKDCRIRVKDSDCRQKICVKHGWLRFHNDVIVCIPNRTIIYIPQESELDFITY